MKFAIRPISLACKALLLASAISVSSGVLAQAAAQPSPPELQEVSRLVRAGQYQPAIERANAFLATKPKDALARFLKGVALTETGKTNDAIATFQSITEDFPELPEPYNNLAVLYASKGQFEKARTALELAIQTHPSYSTAHENLGDVYAKLASQAYDRALQLDKGNSAVQGKLGLIKDLFSAQQKTGQRPDPLKVAALAKDAPKAAEPTKVAAAPVPTPAPTPAPTAAPTPAPTPAPAPVATARPPEPVKVAAAPVAAPAPAPVAAPSKSVAASAETDNVMAAVRGWAGAWAAQDAESYLATYAPNFTPEDGRTRRAWSNERRERVTAPSFIKVDVVDPVVVLTSDTTAEVKFRQNYDSDRIKGHSVRKTLLLTKTKSGWQITRERNG